MNKESEWYHCEECGRVWGHEEYFDVRDPAYKNFLADPHRNDDPSLIIGRGYIFELRYSNINVDEARKQIISAVEGEKFDLKKFPFGMGFSKKLCPACRYKKKKQDKKFLSKNELLFDKNFSDMKKLADAIKVVNSKSIPIPVEKIEEIKQKMMKKKKKK